MAIAHAVLGLTLALPLSSPSLASAQTDNPERLLPPAERRPAPAFTLPDVNGKPISLARLRGRVVLLDFWGIHCGGCNLELPWYVAFDAQYRTQGLSVIGLDLYGDSPTAIRPFALAKGITYPLAVGTDDLAAQYSVTAMPVTLLLDRQGRIALTHTGVINRVAFSAALQQLLRE